MALQDMTPADLAAVVNNDDGGFGNGNGWWIILLFMFLGWGNNGWGNGWGGNGAAATEAMSVYPLMENQQNLFTGFGNLNNAICAGFANAETAATARQMADMQQMNSMQISMLQGFNQQQAQFAQCCCENRLGLANLGADIAREACADRAAVSDGVRDILANQNASVQRVIDWLCADRDSRKDEIIADLRQQIALKDLAASQNLQTAQLTADNAAQTAALEQYLAPVPRPAYMVQNPNCCQPSFGYGGYGCAA